MVLDMEKNSIFLNSKGYSIFLQKYLKNVISYLKKIKKKKYQKYQTTPYKHKDEKITF